MNGFVEFTQTKSQGRGSTSINVESIDRIRRLYVAPNVDDEVATILTLRDGETVYVAESYEVVIQRLKRFAAFLRLTEPEDVQDQPPATDHPIWARDQL